MIDPKSGRRVAGHAVAGRGTGARCGRVLSGAAVAGASLSGSAWRSRSSGLGSSIVRIFALVLTIGLLALIPPLITNFLVNSVIPRTEIDQLVVCALALVVTAVSISSLQVTRRAW